MEPPFFPNPSISIHCSIKMVRGGFESLDLAIAVILVFVFFLETSIVRTKTCWDVGFLEFLMICCQNGCKVLSIRGIVGQSGILGPINFW